MFRYPEERKNAVIQQMLPPLSMSVAELSRSEGLSTKTLYRWRKEAIAGGHRVPERGSSSDRFSAEAKFAIVVETATLSEHELGQYCRERGLFPEQIKDWKQRFIQGAAIPCGDGRPGRMAPWPRLSTVANGTDPTHPKGSERRDKHGGGF
jgi:transposase-like protein